MKTLNPSLSSLCLLATILLAVGCNDDDSNDGPEPTISIQTDARLGSFLVDQEGKALYVFSPDVDGSSACQGGCLDRWPVFYTDELILGDGLDAADFGMIDGNDGPQITYYGWPLYYYSPTADGVIEDAGETQGEAVGNVWYVAKPYSLMIARQIVTSGEDAELYLVDSQGNTLYLFTVDDPGVSNCSGNCITAWPVFPSPDELIIPFTLSASDFTVITRTDGEEDQLAYQNTPLYYFSQDSQRGDVRGEGGK